MYANRNSIPNDPSTAFYPSGVRVGTPLVTTRGMGEPEMVRIAGWIARVVDAVSTERLPDDRDDRRMFLRDFRKRMQTDATLTAIYEEVAAVASTFPLFRW
jgi:glycine hydroxymethyltransferase